MVISFLRQISSKSMTYSKLKIGNDILLLFNLPTMFLMVNVLIKVSKYSESKWWIFSEAIVSSGKLSTYFEDRLLLQAWNFLRGVHLIFHDTRVLVIVICIIFIMIFIIACIQFSELLDSFFKISWCDIPDLETNIPEGRSFEYKKTSLSLEIIHL